MAIYPKAVVKTVTAKKRARMPRPVRINHHTAVSNSTSLFGYFNQAGISDSHFYIREDGTVEQYVDTAYRANCDLKGNPDSISIESWDGYGKVWKNGQQVPAWNPRQLAAIIELDTWIIRNHPTIPLTIASSSKNNSSSHGFSWHQLGVPSTKVQAALGRSQTGGLLWSRAVGKVCPANARIRQIPEIRAAVSAALNGTPIPAPVTPTPEPTPTPSRPSASKAWPAVNLPLTGKHTAASHNAWVKLMTDCGYTRKGESLTHAIQRWLKALGYYKGTIDGQFGPWTVDALQRFLRFKGLYHGALDAFRAKYAVSRGPACINAEIAYLNSQAKHYR